MASIFTIFRRAGGLIIILIEAGLLFGMFICFILGVLSFHNIIRSLFNISFVIGQSVQREFLMGVIQVIDQFLLAVSLFILCRGLHINYGWMAFGKTKPNATDEPIKGIHSSIFTSICIALIAAIFPGAESFKENLDSFDVLSRLLGISAIIVALSVYNYTEHLRMDKMNGKGS